MKIKNIVLVLSLISGWPSIAQTVFRGVVVDAKSNLPISNTKIGITNQGIGVLSNDQGIYSYKKYHETLSDTDKLLVSAPGYESIELKAKEIRALFNRSSTIRLEKSSKKNVTSQVANIKIFWDVSEGMQERDLEEELAIIENYLNAQGTVSVSLEVFNRKIVATEQWMRWDGDMERFRESVTQNAYNSASNYSLLLFNEADVVILVSNGEPNYGKLPVSQDQPVFVLSSIKTKEGMEYLERLTAYTSGSFLIRDTHARMHAREGTSTPNDNSLHQVIPASMLTGKVTSLGQPLNGASITIRGDLAEYTTKADGSFEIPATDGDLLVVRALGMFPKGVAVGEAKNIAIALLPSSDQLDAVVVKGKEKIAVGSKIIEGTNEPNMPGGVTRLGDFYITNKDITPNGKSVAEVLRDKFKGINIKYTPEGEVITVFGETPLWYVNGFQIGPGEPIPLYILDNEILSIVVKEPSMARNIAYGGDGEAGLQILITTKKFRNDFKESSLLAKNNDYTEEVGSIDVPKNVISGTVTGVQGPIQGAEVLRKGTFDVATTKADGSFELNTKNGDILIVTALGMFPKEVIVSDEILYAIQLMPNKNYLDEVVVKGEQRKQEKTKAQEIFNYGPELETGIYKVRGFGSFNVTTITKEDHYFEQYPDLATALFGRFESLFIDKDNGRPYILRGSEQEYVKLFIDGELELGSVDRVSPAEIVSISIKSDRGGSIGKALLIDTNRSGISEKPESLLAKNNDYTEDVEDISTTLQITGTITGPKGPIEDATLTKKGSFNEVVSSGTGEFSITAALGEVLVITASGMFLKEVLIERQDMGVIELTPKSNDLEAIVLDGEERVDNTVETANGKINADKLGYTAETLDENDFSSGYTNLRQLITGKVAGVDVAGGLYSGSEVAYKIRGGSQSINTEKPPIWIINGTPYQDVPNFLDVQQIKSITVLKSVIATSRYGSLASGGAFLIKTKEMDFQNKAAASNKSALVSGNEYTGDVTGSLEAALPAYIIRFRESGTPQEQFAVYKKLSRTQESPLEYYVDAAQYFQSLSPELGAEVRSDLAYIARNNTKALRTLAYLYELVEDTKNVVLVNERIAKIAPQEAQSYRDLALAYQNNKQFDKALELYINMLGEQILGVNFDGLENPLRSELSRLVALHKDKIDFNRLPNAWLRADFKRDMRMVIDWSDRSVPFEFQFVNPDKKFFKWSHTLEETRERLQAEQKQGFQTEEFIIDDAPSGEWIINIQYLGDEGDYVLPPFLKYTVYRDYGTAKETKEVRVIKLFKQVDKVTLGRVVI